MLKPIISMRVIYAIVLSLILLIGGSCTGSKSYSKKAKKLQDAGLNDEAAAFYLESLQRNPKNVDAKIGLKTTGQIQIEKTLTDFYKAYSVANYKEAVYKYQEALNYQRKYGYFVAMEIPPYYEEYYQEMLSVYLDDRYKVAGDLFYQEKFNEAHVIYKEIIGLDSDFKDVKELSLKALLEPMYRNGVEAFENGKYRKCYSLMSEILFKKSDYKDAIDYKDLALEEGQITIAVLDFHSGVKNKQGVANTIQGKVVSGVIGIQDPFIKVLDRSNVEALIKEQKINVAEATNGKSAIRTGELLGADILVRGVLLTYSYSGGRARGREYEGFERIKVKKTNPETKKTYKEIYYKKVTYREYTGSSSLHAKAQYQIISAETGEVIQANVLSDYNSDQVHYIDYSGNSRYLYKGKLTDADKASKNKNGYYSNVSNLVSLKRLARETKRTLKTESELSTSVVNNISRGITRQVSKIDIDEL